MGSKGGGSSSGQMGFNASTSTYTPNPEAMASYRKALGMAENVASIPYQPYGGQMTAGFTPDQMAAFQATRNAQNMAQPYYNTASNMIGQAVDYSDPRNFNAKTLNQYYSPFQQNVIDATMKNLASLQGQAYNQRDAQAAAQGGWGGSSGAAMGRAEVARQQGLSNAQTLAGLQQQGYNQAVQQFNQQQQQAIQTAQNAAYGLGTLGGQAQQAALQGIQALMGTGGMQQQLAQQQLTGAYQQWQQERAYPYQQAAFYSGISGGIAPNMGGTTNTIGFGTGSSQQQQSGGGGGGGGGMGMLSSVMSFLPMLMGSDRKDKTDIKYIGDVDGEKMYEYRYKGDPKSYPKVVGPMAQDIEKHSPERVHEIGGHKVVEGFGRFARENAADGGSQGLSLGNNPADAASGLGALGQNAYSAPSKAAGYIDTTTQGQNAGSAQATGALGIPQQGQALDPGMSQFLQGVFDPQTAYKMAQAKWVNQGNPLNEPQQTGDNYVIPPDLMNDGGSTYPYHPQQNEPMADGGRVHRAEGGGFGSFMDLVKQGGVGGPYSEAPGNYMAAAQQLGLGKIIPQAKDPAPSITGKEAERAASAAQKLPNIHGSGGGGSGGHAAGAPKMPEMKMPKPKETKPAEKPFDPYAGGAGTPGGSSGAPGPESTANQPSASEPVSQANQEAGQKGFNFAEQADPIQSSPVVEQANAAPAPAPEMSAPAADFAASAPPLPEIPLMGFGFGMARGGRAHKDGGGAAGGVGGLGGNAGIGGFGDGSTLGVGIAGPGKLGQEGTLGDIVLGGFNSPSQAAGFDQIGKSQEKFTGQDQMKHLTDQYWELDPGAQKSPTEQGMPAMPDSKYYTTPRTDLPGKLQSEHQGEQNSSPIPLLMGLSGNNGMGMMGFGLQLQADQQNAAAKGTQANLQKQRADMLSDPANFPVEGYFSSLDSTSKAHPEMGMQLNPRTGLYNLKYTGAYRGMPYKDGGRVAKADGGSLIDRVAAGIAAIETGGRRGAYETIGVRSRTGDRPYGKYQIMGNNIAKWGAEAGFPHLTKEQFLNNPQIQEAVARFQFAKILQKSGGNPMAVAGEWLGGPGWRHNTSRDALGTSVPEYQRRFARAFGNPNMVASAEPVRRAVPYDPTHASSVFRPRDVVSNVSPLRVTAAPTGSIMKAAAAEKPGLFSRLAHELSPVTTAQAGDLGKFPGDTSAEKPFYKDPKIQKSWDERPPFEGTKATAAPVRMTDREVMEAVGRGEHINYDAEGNAVRSAPATAAASNQAPATAAPEAPKEAPVVDPYGFGQLTRQANEPNEAQKQMGPGVYEFAGRGTPDGGMFVPSWNLPQAAASDAAESKPAQKYWGDYRDVEKNDFGDMIDELAGDVRKSDVAGKADTPMGKFQGEGGLGSLFDMEGTLPGQFASGGVVRHAYRDGGGDSTEDFLRSQGIGVAEQGPPAPGFTDELTRIGGSQDMPTYDTPHMSFEGQSPYRVPEESRVNIPAPSMPHFEDRSQNPDRYSWRLRDHLPKLEDYGLRMPELHWPGLAKPEFAAPNLRVPELRNPRMNNLPDALWGRQQGPELPSAHPNMGPEMPATAGDTPAPLPTRRPANLTSAPKHVAPKHHAAPRHRSAPKSKGLYWGDWRDAPGFDEDVIGGALDNLTGDVKSSRKKGNINSQMSPYRGGKGGADLGDLLGFANGGAVRMAYATRGGVEGDDEIDPLGALEGGLGQLGDAIGGMFEGGGGEQPAAAQDYAYEGPKAAGSDFLTQWSQNPLSQLLWHAGQGMMASNASDPLQIASEGLQHGMPQAAKTAQVAAAADAKAAEAAQKEQEMLDLQKKMYGDEGEPPEAAGGEGAAVPTGGGEAEEPAAGGAGAAARPTGASSGRIEYLESEIQRIGRMPVTSREQLAEKKAFIDDLKWQLEREEKKSAVGKIDIKEVGTDQYGRKQYMYLSGPNAGQLVDPNKLRPAGGADETGAPAQDISKLHGDKFLEQLPPGVAEEVAAIGRGDKELPKGKQNQDLVKLVYQYKPDYKEDTYREMRDIRKGYEPQGKVGQQITSAVAAMGHINRLLDLTGELHNKKIPMYNMIANPISSMLGSDAVGNFDTVKKRLVGEVEKYIKGGEPAEAGLERALDDIKSSSSPQQIIGALHELSEVMGTKTKTYQETWKKRFGDEEMPVVVEDIDTVQNRLNREYEKFHPKKQESQQVAPASPSLQAGHEEGGYRFKGGNPGDPNAWEKI